MLHRNFAQGDRIVHLDKPEWGGGVVSKTQLVTQGGARVQILTVRFDNAGTKSLSTTHARLRYEADHAAEGTVEEKTDHSPAASVVSGMLADGDSFEDCLLRIPQEARDPFLPLRQRVEATLHLYRFDGSARSLIDWGVAQSGLADPLSKLTRHELELVFQRWARERDLHLHDLLQRLGKEDADEAGRLTATLPPDAADALRRLTSRR